MRLFEFMIALALLGFAGCSVGPHYLKADQVEYARALGEAKKREILSMIVGLRYADAPGFLNVSQIIAAYTLDLSATPVVNARPDPGGPSAGLSGMATYSDHPTFTFTPTTGDYFARAYIHPLAPALILPLADSGIPVDLLLRTAVQSIAGLNNATMLGGPSGNGSPGFFELLSVLRRLQLAGQVAFHLKVGTNGQAISMYLAKNPSAGAASSVPDLNRARELLKLSSEQSDFDIVDQSSLANSTKEVSIATRSVLAILTVLGAEIAVPDADVRRGATKPAIALVGGETRPILVVHSGRKAPFPNYTAVAYGSSQFWIDDTDFDSKYALTLVQDIMALAEVTDTAHTPVLTLPAG